MAINGVQRKEVVLLADKPARCNVDCANILTHDGCSLQRVAELRYLRIFIARARTFRCSLNYAKRSFFGAVNGLFGKLLNLASETEILELVRSRLRF